MSRVTARLRRFAVVICLLPALALTAPQDHVSPNDGPWRTLSDGADEHLMLLGHDAVAYFTDNAAVRGDPTIKALQAEWEAHRAAGTLPVMPGAAQVVPPR